MKIRRFNSSGMEKFEEFLWQVKGKREALGLKELLESPAFTEVIGSSTEKLDEMDLSNKLLVAKSIDELIKDLGLKSAEKDTGFWSWCSAYLFEKLTKRGHGDTIKPGEIAIWIPQYDNWKRFYRHYLASIWRVYIAHTSREDILAVLLHGPVNTPGELWGQFAANQSLITSPTIIQTLYTLYWDSEKKERKRGAGGESPRRLVRVLNQFERNWDFFSMESEGLLSILPREFDRFKDKTSMS